LNLWSIFEDSPSGAYYYARGFNWLALVALVLGQAIYIFLYNPITGETHEWFLVAPASLTAFLGAGVVYWVGMRLLAIGVGEKIADRPAERRLITPNI